MNPFTPKKRMHVRFISVVALTFFLCACGNKTPEYITTSLTIEAGNTFSANDFIIEDGHSAEFVDEFATQYVQNNIAKINHIGNYPVNLMVDNKTYILDLTVQDTISPKASARVLSICQGDSLTAEQCVTDVIDQTNVTCTFQTEPNLTQVGISNETVILTDEAGNSTEIPVSITVLEQNKFLLDKYTIEAGEDIPAVAELIVFNRTGKYATDVSAIDTSLIGNYTLDIEIEDTIYSTELIIEDTIAPTATVTPVSVYYGAPFPLAECFISEILDEGPVTISYETDPGVTVNAETTVRILLTDQAGNITTYDSLCGVLNDDEAPKFIKFPQELRAEVNTNIIWKSLVSAEDNSGVVDISLDATGVNLSQPGTYDIFFIAKDPSGNETKQKAKLTVYVFTVTKEMMDQVCADITSKIITEGMTTQEKLYAVFKYVVSKIRYTGGGSHDDMRKEAYLGLTSRKSGDCFTFCAASNELLSYLGFETQIVRRRVDLASQHGNHFWVLVNCGTKDSPLWYHHDAAPHVKPYTLDTYMMTDAQLKAYTNYRASTSTKQHYYTFDPSLYPASATQMTVDLGIDPMYFE